MAADSNIRWVTTSAWDRTVTKWANWNLDVFADAHSAAMCNILEMVLAGEGEQHM